MKKTITRILLVLITAVCLMAIWGANGNLSVKRMILISGIALAGALIIFVLDKFDGKIIDTVINGKLGKFKVIDCIAFLIVIAISVIVRTKLLYFESEDYKIFYSKWVEQIRNIGWHSFGCRIGDYSPLYMSFLIPLAMTKLPVSFVVRAIPLIFDYALAAVCVAICKSMKPNLSAEKCLAVFTCIVLNPLVLLNTAVWGQCDVVYSFFVLVSVLLMMKAETNPKITGDLIMLFVAIAFSFKLQTVLFLPMALFYWVKKRKDTVKLSQFLYIPLLYIATGIPALMAGKSFKDVLEVYFAQSGEYTHSVNMRYPNFYTFLGDKIKSDNPIHAAYFSLGLFLAAVVLGLIYYYAIKKEVKLNCRRIALFSVLTVLTLDFFLPSIHERYAFVAEMLLLVLAFAEEKMIVPAICTIVCTLASYGEYLSNGAFLLTQTEHILIAVVRLGILTVLIKNSFVQDDTPGCEILEVN